MPESELYLLIGADGLAELDTWHEWREIVALCKLAVLARPDWELSQIRDRVPAETYRRVLRWLLWALAAILVAQFLAGR